MAVVVSTRIVDERAIDEAGLQGPALTPQKAAAAAKIATN